MLWEGGTRTQRSAPSPPFTSPLFGLLHARTPSLSSCPPERLPLGCKLARDDAWRWQSSGDTPSVIRSCASISASLLPLLLSTYASLVPPSSPFFLRSVLILLRPSTGNPSFPPHQCCCPAMLYHCRLALLLPGRVCRCICPGGLVAQRPSDRPQGHGPEQQRWHSSDRCRVVGWQPFFPKAQCPQRSRFFPLRRRGLPVPLPLLVPPLSCTVP